jgi:8-oxo-dGTP pyrophosphatase MutT (NUDIX family)
MIEPPNEPDWNSHGEVVKVLRAIPSHRDAFLTALEIAQKLDGVALPEALGFTRSVIAFLDFFGVLRWENGRCKITSQIPNYFRHSLIWYFTNHQSLLSNWDRSGTSRTIATDNLLDLAPYFLKILEEKRVELARRDGLECGDSREQPVSVVLIKVTDKGTGRFLHQWDNRAEQYQLIGGRQREAESQVDAAAREFIEEVGATSLVRDRDFRLLQLTTSPIVSHELSRTYGALTRYEYSVYWVTMPSFDIVLPHDVAWISLSEMRAGRTASGRAIARLGHLLEGGGVFLEMIQDSIPSPAAPAMPSPLPIGGNGLKSSRASIPAWFGVAGFVTATIVLVFFMALLIAGMRGTEIPHGSRFLAVIVLALGTALATTFLSGNVAAGGGLPMPFLKGKTLAMSATGGVATLIIVLLLGYQIFVKGS